MRKILAELGWGLTTSSESASRRTGIHRHIRSDVRASSDVGGDPPRDARLRSVLRRPVARIACVVWWTMSEDESNEPPVD